MPADLVLVGVVGLARLDQAVYKSAKSPGAICCRTSAGRRCSVGLGSYPEAIQQALRRTDSPLRQFPDILAARGPAVVAIDAKTSMSGGVSGRFAVSRKCLTAGLQFQGQNIDVPLRAYPRRDRLLPERG